MTSFLRTAWQRLTSGRPAAPPPVPAASPLRPVEPELAARIATFWSGFEALRPRLERELRANLSGELQELLSEQVRALHPELRWEAGRAPDGGLELSLTGEGDFLLRKLAGHWHQAAPALPGWHFHPARPASPGALGFALRIAGQDVAFAQLRFGLAQDAARARVDVQVWHPALASLPPDTHTMVAFLALDALLGEDDVERWVGRVEVADEATEAFVPPEALLQEVAALAATPRDTFAHLQGKNAQGRAALATLNLALKRLDHLAYEDQLVVTVAYRSADAQGLPPPEEHAAAQALEDQLVESLAGLALHYGHVVSGGRLEVLFYVADRRAAEGRLAAWRARCAGWQVQRAWHHDPEWKALLKW